MRYLVSHNCVLISQPLSHGTTMNQQTQFNGFIYQGFRGCNHLELVQGILYQGRSIFINIEYKAMHLECI